MDRCAELLALTECDAAVVMNPSDVFYLCGYDGTAGMLVLTDAERFFLTDARYTEEADATLRGRFTVAEGGMAKARELLGRAKRVARERAVSYDDFAALDQILPAERRFLDEAIRGLREIKSPAEIAKIRAAQAITDAVFTAILPEIREGVTEIELAARIEYEILRRGAALAFESIVAFGKNGSKPHAHRSGEKLRNGMFATMDFGAKYQGYCSDMTRTVALGSVSAEQRALYESVLEAQLTAIGGIRAGMTGKACDALARDTLEARGLGNYFTHSLGHGVGVDIHEGAGLSPKNENPVQAGMVVSVEPGVYVPGKAGVRIEDIAVIGEDGVDVLTRSDKNLIIL